MARSARCDVRWGPPSSSDPTKRFCQRISSVIDDVSSAPPADRRREHRGRGSRLRARLLRRRSQTISVSARSDQICSLRSPRLALVSRCLPHSLAGEKHVCSLARPGQRRARLTQHGEGRDPSLIAPLAFARSARIAPSSSPTSSSLTDDKACLLAPPQHGEGRDPSLIAPHRLGKKSAERLQVPGLGNLHVASTFCKE